MIDWVLSAAGLAVLVGIVLTGPWPRGLNQPTMSSGKRAVMFLSAAAALYLLLACVSDFTARRMIVYGEAMQVVSHAKVFRDEVGEPFTVAWPIILSAGVTDAGNDAAFRAKVKGPRGKGVLVVVGSKGRAGWTLTRVDLVMSQGKSASLLTEGAAQ